MKRGGWGEMWASMIAWAVNRKRWKPADDALVDQLDVPRHARVQARDVRERARTIARTILKLYVDTPVVFLPFDAAGLDAGQRAWLDRQRDALATLGYTMLADVWTERAAKADGTPNPDRLMLSPDRGTVASIWRVEHPHSLTECIELISELEDGGILATNTLDRATPFAQPATFDTAYLPRDTDANTLVAAHVARLAGRATRPAPDLEAVQAQAERVRRQKRQAARARGWADDAELRTLLGANFDVLRDAVRAELDASGEAG
jgi:hypothetical protein